MLLIFLLSCAIVARADPSADIAAASAAAPRQSDEDDNIFQTFPKESAEHELLQQEFLHLLGLESRPSSVVQELRHNSAPHFLRQIYNTLHHLSTNEDAKADASDFVSDETDAEKILSAIANADMIISYPNRGTNFTYPGHIHEYLYFDSGSREATAAPLLAELRLYKELSPYFPATGSQFTLSLYQVVDSGNGTLELELLSWKSVHPYYFGWIVFDVTELMKKWVSDPFSNFGLHIVVRDADNPSVEYPLTILGISGNSAPDFKQPFLVAFFETFPEPPVIRRRRAAAGGGNQYSYDTINHDPYLSAKTRCQRKSLFVSFAELGWQDWVLAPNGYQAYHCAGECRFPMDINLNATNHAIMQTLMNFYEPQGVPPACCAPKKLSAQSILYFDDNSNVILKVYRDMVIEYCGCH